MSQELMSGKKSARCFGMVHVRSAEPPVVPAIGLVGLSAPSLEAVQQALDGVPGVRAIEGLVHDPAVGELIETPT